MYRNTHRIDIRRLTVVAMLVLVAAPAAVATDWVNFRGPNQDNSIAGDGILGRDAFGLEVEWARPLGPGYSGIAVAGERVITLFSDGEFDVTPDYVASDLPDAARWLLERERRGEESSR